MSVAGLAPEQALFLRLAGSAPGDPELTALLAGPVNWATVRALARREGASGVVWRRLLAAGATLPEEVAAAFEREARVADFAGRALERQLGEVLRLLAAEGIRPVLLKGAALAWSVYGGGFVDRPAQDVDLLVTRDGLERAQGCLIAAGWRPVADGAAAERYTGHHHLVPLAAPGGGPGIVELHGELFQLGHPFRADVEALLAAARPLATPVGEVLVLPPEEQLLHACLHFAWSHELRWSAWRAISDVTAIVSAASAASGAMAEAPGAEAPGAGEARHAEGPGAGGAVPGAASAWRSRTLRWGRFLTLAREARGGTAAFWTLRLAATVGGAPIPQGALGALVPALPSWALRWVERHLVHQLLPGPGNAPSVRLQRGIWRMAMQPVRAGHGGVRPWTTGMSSPVAEGAAREAVSVGARVRGQLRQGGRWRRYLLSIGRRSGGRR